MAHAERIAPLIRRGVAVGVMMMLRAAAHRLAVPRFDVVDYLRDEQDIAAYLQETRRQGGALFIRKAIRNVQRARARLHGQ